MNADRIRFLDRTLGRILCAALTVIRRAEDLLRGRRAADAPRRVLVIKMTEMGSTLLAWPALRELRARVPGVELTFLVSEDNRPILDVLAGVLPGRVVSVDLRSPGTMLAGGFRAVVALARWKPDAVLDMDFFSRFTAALSYVVCRGERVGFHPFAGGPRRGDLLTRRVLYSTQVHTGVAFVALVRALLAPAQDEPFYRGAVDDADLSLPPWTADPADVGAVRAKLTAAGVGESAVIVLVNPNSSQLLPLRRWPLDSYIALCRDLLARREATVVVTGTGADAADAERLVSAVGSPRCVSLAGRTSLGELLALGSLSAAIVTNDGGPAHFAALAGLPSVVLFGPETPALYRPLSADSRCLYAGFPCSPCVSAYNAKESPCRRSLCLEAIPPAKVREELAVVLDRRAARASPAGTSS